MIVAEWASATRYGLFATERDRRRWHLVREAMTAGTPAERVAS
jgi:hypothetical protein